MDLLDTDRLIVIIWESFLYTWMISANFRIDTKIDKQTDLLLM